jgi:hypothetical protein
MKTVSRVALFFAVLIGACLSLARPAAAQSYPLYCRGGGNGEGSLGSYGLATSSLIGTQCEFGLSYSRTFSPGTIGEQFALTAPAPGECRWKDRAFSGDPTNLYLAWSSSDCNRHSESAVGFTITNGTTTLFALDAYDSDQGDQTWAWPLTWNPNAYYTLNVHASGAYLIVDNFLCSGDCQ